MNDIVNLGARRASQSEYARDTAPRDVLLRVIEDIDNGRTKADHVMVITGHLQDDGKQDFQVDQGGVFNRFAQIGLMFATLSMLERH